MDLRIAWYDLRQFFKGQRRAFWMMLCCLSVAVFAMSYFYTYYTGLWRAYRQDDRALYTLNIHFDLDLARGFPVMTQARDAGLRQCFTWRDMPPLSALRYEGDLQLNRQEGERLEAGGETQAALYVFGIAPEDNGRINVETYDGQPVLCAGRWLNASDVGTSNAVVHQSLVSGQAPARITLRNDDAAYDVVGVAVFNTNYSHDSCIAIAQDTFVQRGYPLKTITVLTDVQLTNEQRGRLQAQIAALFPGYSFSAEAQFDEDNALLRAGYQRQLSSCVLLGALACVNAMSVFAYWVKCSLQPYMVYLRCGLSGRRLKRVLLWEIVLIDSASLLVGMGLYYAALYLLPSSAARAGAMTPGAWLLFYAGFVLLTCGGMLLRYRRPLRAADLARHLEGEAGA
nr:hypothetical protein [Maliibacterium massiliense]